MFSPVVLSRSSAQTQVPTVLTVKHLQPKEFIIRLNKSNPYGHIPKRQLCRTTRFFSDQLAARRCHSFLAFSPITVKTPAAPLSPRDGAARVPRQGLYTRSGREPQTLPSPPGRPGAGTQAAGNAPDAAPLGGGRKRARRVPAGAAALVPRRPGPTWPAGGGGAEGPPGGAGPCRAAAGWQRPHGARRRSVTAGAGWTAGGGV